MTRVDSLLMLALSAFDARDDDRAEQLVRQAVRAVGGDRR
jgi:hypothetical protein